MKQNKKDKILKYLNSTGISSTRKIADYIKSNGNDANNFLFELLTEKKISCMKVKDKTYWSLKFKDLPKFQSKEDIKREIKKVKHENNHN
jgi:hypothetical protein